MSMQFDTNSKGVSFQNVFSSQFAENPYPIFAQLRSKGAVVPVPAPLDETQKTWMVTRMEEAVQVLKDHQRFTVDRSTASSKELVRRREELSSNAPGFFTQSMISVDEPDHRRLRGLLSKAFTPKYIQNLRPNIQQIADELLDEVQDQGGMDLVSDYAYPLPINVISDMMGVPTEHREHMRKLSELIASGGPLASGDPNGEAFKERIAAARGFSDYVVQLVAEKRQHPQGDLISQ